MSVSSTLIEAQILNLGQWPVRVTGTFSVGSVLTASLSAGYAATGYQWTRNGSDISGQTSSTYTIQSGDRGTTIGCRATGLSYAASGATVPYTVPGAPTITGVSAANQSVTATFNAPADTGGTSIIGYQMAVYRASDNTLLGTTSGAASPLTRTGLTNGVAVYVKVAAVNSVGVGPQSSASSNVTPNLSAVSKVINGAPLNATSL